jgi:hypothetical protein
MLTAKARLHIQNHNEPNGRAIIVGERAALKALSNALLKASQNALGLEQVELYTSDGHKYEILVTCDASEEEWQQLPVPYDKKHDLNNLQIIKTLDEIKNTSISKK